MDQREQIRRAYFIEGALDDYSWLLIPGFHFVLLVFKFSRYPVAQVIYAASKLSHRVPSGKRQNERPSGAERSASFPLGLLVQAVS